VVDYLDAFAVDLFLTTNRGDAQRVIDSGQCAAAVLKAPPREGLAPPEDQVRIAFDGDAVLFADASEVIYKQQGLTSFQEQEDASRHEPMAPMPSSCANWRGCRIGCRLRWSNHRCGWRS
jgi:5'-nucleotidase